MREGATPTTGDGAVQGGPVAAALIPGRSIRGDADRAPERIVLVLVFAPLWVAFAFGAGGSWLDAATVPAWWLAERWAAAGPWASVLLVPAVLVGLQPAPRRGPVKIALHRAGVLLGDAVIHTLIAHLLSVVRPLHWPLALLILDGVLRRRLVTPPPTSVTAPPSGTRRSSGPLGHAGDGPAARFAAFATNVLIPIVAAVLAPWVGPFGPGLPIPEALAVVLDNMGIVGVLALTGPITIWAVAVVRAAPGRGWWAPMFLCGAAALAAVRFDGREEWLLLSLWAALATVPLAGSVWRALGTFDTRPVLALLLGIALPISVPARFDCDRVVADKPVRRLSEDPGFFSVAAVPGNIAVPLVIHDGGASISRLSPDGEMLHTAPLDPPGGVLLGPALSGGPVVRVLPTATSIRADWIDSTTLQRVDTTEASARCERWAEPLLQADGRAVWWSCPTSGVHHHLPRGSEPPPPWRAGVGTIAAEPLQDHLLHSRGGATGRSQLYAPDRRVVEDSGATPGLRGAEVAPGRWVLARAGTRRLDLRGPGVIVVGVPGLEPPAPGPAGTWAGTLARRVDAIRLPHDPERPRLSLSQRAVWTWSRSEATVALSDLDVTWMQLRAHLGAPPRSVAVDPLSGTLFAANRCGLFSVVVPRIDPWAGTDLTPTPADVNPSTTGGPTPSPAP